MQFSWSTLHCSGKVRLALMSVLCHRFPPLSEWALLSTAALKTQLPISYLLMVFYQVEKAALEESCVITKLGERMTLISPTNVPFWSTAAGVNVATWMQQHSGMAQPCSLTLQRGGMGCKELNKQASTLQRGVKRGGDIQLGRCKTGQ